MVVAVIVAVNLLMVVVPVIVAVVGVSAAVVVVALVPVGMVCFVVLPHGSSRVTG
jgi:hypothetical protein